MPFLTYSYKLRREVPLLTEEEYASLGTVGLLESIREYRAKTGVGLAQAKALSEQGKIGSSLQRYYELTGCRLRHPDMLYAVAMSHYGALCPDCDKPFRTPRARFCAECGFRLPDGEVAGPLIPKN